MIGASNKPSKENQASMSREYHINHTTATHLTMSHRIVIERAYNTNLRLPQKDRLSLRKLAKSLGIPAPTLIRELKRGIVSSPNTFKDRDIFDYSAQKAQADVDLKAMNRGCGMKMTTSVAALLRKEIVNDGRSPYDARCKLLKLNLTWVPSESTIYNHIAHGDIGIEYGQTPYHPSKSRKRRLPPRRPLNNPGAISIEERPDISCRTEFGHWEMDTIVSCVGGSGGLLVMIERKTRFFIVEKLNVISQKEVLRALRRILRSGRMKKILSITTDNGCEFLNHQEIVALMAKANQIVKLYYTHAYSAWEKGSAENANRLVRRRYPKGTDFGRLNRSRIRELQDFINSIARKVSLKGKTANEAYSAAA
jgi:transposase, IS30 family